MKKLILILFLSIQITSLLAQPHIPPKYSGIIPVAQKAVTSADLPGTIFWYTWDQERWSATLTVTMTYNSSGNPVTRLHDMVTGADVKNTYTYDEQGRLIQVLTQLKDDGLWLNSTRTSCEFDNRGNEILRTFEDYISGVWMIQNGVRTDLEYQDDQVYRETVSFFDQSNGSYYLFWRFTYAYSDGVCTGYVNEAYRNGAWVNYFRAFLFYDEENRPDYNLYDAWDTLTGAWVTDEMERYSYSGEMDQTLILYQFVAETNLYVPTERYISEYDDHRNQILTTSEVWLDGGWSIAEGNRSTISYDEVHAISRITETWIAENEATTAHWENSTKEEFSDFQSSGVEGLAAPAIQLTCFPNPTAGTVEISYATPRAGNVELTLMTLDGKITCCSKEPGLQGKVLWDLDILPAGIYIVRLTDQAGTVITRKIIKE
jgi:hypothetical protein